MKDKKNGTLFKELTNYNDMDRGYVSADTRIIHNKVLKLDQNFHLYIHGSTDLIDLGEDEKGKFIKVRYEKMD